MTADPVPSATGGVAIGIDIGGTGIKAGLVDLASGELRSRRVRRATPRPATPEAVVATAVSCVADLIAARRPA